MTITSYVTPLAAGSVAARRSGELFIGLRTELDELTRQLTSGKKAESYGGLGFERGASLDARATMSRLAGYRSAIESAELRTSMVTKGIETLTAAVGYTKTDILPPKFELDAQGRTNAQKDAEQRLQLTVDILNSDVAGRYLFAGRAQDVRPVETAERILEGGDGKIGLREYIALRKEADTGSPPTGRMSVAHAPSSGTVTIGPDNADGYGLAIVGVPSVTQPPPGPATININSPTGSAPFDVQFNGAVQSGTTITLDVAYPDGTTKTIELIAKTPPAAPATLAPNEFAADADPTVSAASFAAQLAGQFATHAQSAEFQAASAVRATKDFFLGTEASPPPKILPDTRDVLVWYKGDGLPEPLPPPAPKPDPRATAPVRIAENQTVGIGAQANEPAFRTVIAQFALLAAESFTNAAGEKERYEALTNKVYDKLADPPVKMSDVAFEIGAAMTAMNEAKERHKATDAMLLDVVDSIEAANPEEVAASIVALRTRLEASYQTTSMLAGLSLVNYL